MIKSRKTDKLTNLTSGPGKLAQALQIDKSLNATSATDSETILYIEDRGLQITSSEIIETKRVGIDYAGEWKDKPLRFYIKDNPFVSKR